MLNKLQNYLLIAFAFLFTNVAIHAQSTQDSLKSDTLIVGVAGSEPFVFKQGSDEKGIAVDVWEKLAKRMTGITNLFTLKQSTKLYTPLIKET